MDYKCPMVNDLGGVGDVMNPLFIDNAVALGPTRVMASPQAGYAFVPQYGLDGRHYGAHYFEPGYFELSGRHFDRNYFEHGHFELSGVREALDVFTAAAFLFPE